MQSNVGFKSLSAAMHVQQILVLKAFELHKNANPSLGLKAFGLHNKACTATLVLKAFGLQCMCSSFGFKRFRAAWGEENRL